MRERVRGATISSSNCKQETSSCVALTEEVAAGASHCLSFQDRGANIAIVRRTLRHRWRRVGGRNREGFEARFVVRK